MTKMSKKLRQSVFGGPLLKGANARSVRPLSAKNIVISFTKTSYFKDISFISPHVRQAINVLIQLLSKQTGFAVAEVRLTHSEITIRSGRSNRQQYCRFVRSFTGILARDLTGSQRGRPLKEKVRFWKYRPITLVGPWIVSLEIKQIKNISQFFESNIFHFSSS